MMVSVDMYCGVKVNYIISDKVLVSEICVVSVFCSVVFFLLFIV